MKQTMDRREFVATAGAAGTALAMSSLGLPIVAGPFLRQAADHFVPADKKLSREWVASLFARGQSTWYAGDDLRTIGMPIGGICAGQVYLTGDGRLVYWDIFNQNENTGYGAVNYHPGRAPEQTVEDGKIVSTPPLDQGFVLRVRSGGRTMDRTLDRRGFPGVRFCGEFPIARVRYADPSLPVEVRLDAFSPFIPLNAADSSIPATVLRYAVKNTSSAEAEVTLAGWLENAVCRHTGPLVVRRLLRRNAALEAEDLTGLLATAEAVAVPAQSENPPRVFADFEGDDYGNWTVEGEAFGRAPARGTLPDQNPVDGFAGRGLVNSFVGGDGSTGKLRSPAFTIDRPWIGFLVGGGAHEGRTCINLIVDGNVVRSATGRNRERLEPHNWDVRDLMGREARLEIVDVETGGWGHINVDQIEFRDSPMVREEGALATWSDYGSLCLAVAGKGFCRPSVAAGPEPDAVLEGRDDVSAKPVGELLRGVVGRTLTLRPGEEQSAVFVLGWWLPNMRRDATLVGNRYATRFDGADAVAGYVVRNLDRLSDETRLWHTTYYDSTLPHWLLDRVHSTAANLATTTCQWWKSGRFWAWEGAGCCRGTCGHVWNYAHTMARLFPELERSVREMQDFAPGIGLHPDGAIGFRGEGWTDWAGDAQGGYILKAWREHQTSPDDAFLRRNWPNIRKAMQFLIDQDGNEDGVLEGRQPQTYDQDFYGANTMVGSLYLGALRAAEEMATEVGDTAFAATCRRIFEAGRVNTVRELFNGEYFIQLVDLKQHPDWQYGDGCLADQLFGQGWAHQTGLGYLYPEQTVKTALRSIWKYSWAPDVGPQNKAHDPERWFAYPGEAGLFECTWPKTPHMGPRSTEYRDEVWTGTEYQVAGHMAWEGMLTEALAICRGVHERYHPARHNPWNEIECGDHYARSMASWSVLIALSGFEYHGPKGHVGFAPRLVPEHFRSAFTAAEGWGGLSQSRAGRTQTSAIAMRWGRLRLRTMALELPERAALKEAVVTVDGRRLAAAVAQQGRRVTLTAAQDVVIGAGSHLEVVLHW
ncbi:MAG TPA: GH116 family glycosyl hydrolase [Gemmatimonadales bacterium]|nr:GH116 family glycosyl hydrolase [Gemmatimonadales bacterium]